MSASLLNLKAGVYRRLGDRQYAAGGDPVKAPLAAVTEAINEAIRHLYSEIEMTGHFPLYKYGRVTFGNHYPTQVITAGSDNFQLGMGNVWTQTILLNAAASTIQTEIRAIDPHSGSGSLDNYTPPIVTGSDGGPWTVLWLASQNSAATPRHNIPLIRGASPFTGQDSDIVVTGDAIGSIEQEVGIDSVLRLNFLGSSNGSPDYRGSIYADIAYGSGDIRVPIPFAEGGQFTHNWVHQGGSWIPRSQFSGIWWNRYMYLRGRKLGFVDRPSSETTIRVYYNPLVPELSVDGDTFQSAGIPDMEQWKDLIACRAATQSGADIHTEQYAMIDREYSRRESEFRETIASVTNPVPTTELERY